jgi:hypothetical protein
MGRIHSCRLPGGRVFEFELGPMHRVANATSRYHGRTFAKWADEGVCSNNLPTVGREPTLSAERKFPGLFFTLR